ncbi:phage tail sheath protein, partial [Corallococcus sp. AB038B]
QVNVVRQEPRAFLTLSADTLATDPELRPIHVRRLLSLLRRAALRLGATYVFEPNDASFRRRVQRGFESLLGDLFVRGAFAGKTREGAFQVVTGSELNTPSLVEQGRFYVDLRVAPSQPLTFLNVRLVQ